MTKRTCSINGCDKQSKARGFCAVHYSRWRGGRPIDAPIRKMSKTPEASFANHTEWQDDCLIWTGAVHDNGYGIIWTGKRLMRAHRWAYEQEHGPIERSTDVDHICGNRLCCNIDHLRVATRKQNMENYTVLSAKNKSGYRGVSRNKRDTGWRVRVKHNYREYFGGDFKDLEEANAAAIALRNKLFTHNDRDRIEEAPA